MSTEAKGTYSESNESLVVYEVGYLLVPTIPEEKVEGVVARIKGVLADKKAEIISEGAPSMQALAYEMSKVIETKRHKFDHAYFGWVKFEAESSDIANIKKNIEAIDEIVRCLFVKTVRENTLMSQKMEIAKEEEKAEKKDGEVSVEAPAEDIDKTIDALVTN